ncbi:LysM peptidoglycan-binding domain-containing protein [Luethyella okanaganae]|uniref:LysM peptidoglycan-binding domain-containing protein n=1 Tax=Luethyella okanaganae TaxID=69372 RepID=A0ABW1VHG2_9MICO
MSAVLAQASVGLSSTAPVARVHLHLTRRGRVVLTTLAALPLVFGAFVFALNGGIAIAGADGQGASSFEYVTVQSGESLWSLAESIAPAADPRDVIAELVSLNQLQTSEIEPGQRLAIPEKY